MADDRLFDFPLPDLGEGVVEGEVVRWLVQPGQEIGADQPLVQVMTDKATVEIPSPRKGTVRTLYVEEGAIVPVGASMVQLALAAGEAPPPAMHVPVKPPKAAPARKDAAARPHDAGETPALPGAGGGQALPGGGGRPALPADRDGVTRAPAAVLPPERKPAATPAVRQLARELGVDLAQLQGTGPAGRITREDVEAASLEPASAAAILAPRLTFAPGEREQRIPVRGLRRKIAEKMVQSAFSAPHVTHVDECDMTALSQLRARARPLAEERGLKLSYLPFVIKACVAALKRHPKFNAAWDQESGDIVLKAYYHIGFGVATDQGLLVGVVKDADAKSPFELAREIRDIAGRVRAGKASLDELTGSTFTITNFGSLGGLFATPIINPPEVAILGLGKIAPRPVVRDGAIVVRDMMYVALSFDHRVVDGADGVHFTTLVIRMLEAPELLFLDQL